MCKSCELIRADLYPELSGLNEVLFVEPTPDSSSSEDPAPAAEEEAKPARKPRVKKVTDDDSGNA